MSRSGSESLEGVSTFKAPALRDDIVPVVWSFSKLQSAATSKMMIETAGDDPLRELMQVLQAAEACSSSTFMTPVFSCNGPSWSV